MIETARAVEAGRHGETEDGGISAFCPIYHRAIELIGSRWTGAIVRAVLSGRSRFSDIAEAIPGLSGRMLSDRLKTLEAEGIVVRTVYPEIPVRVEYRLTEKGQALAGVVAAVTEWAAVWGLDAGQAPADGAATERFGATAERDG